MSALQKYKKIAQEAEAKLAAKDKVIEDLRDRLQYCGQERDALFLLESCNLEDAAEFLERFKKAFPHLWNMLQECRKNRYRDGLMHNFEQYEKERERERKNQE